MSISIVVNASEVECRSGTFTVKYIESLRQAFVSDDVTFFVEEIDFPIKEQTYGSIGNVYKEGLPIFWKNIATKETKELVSKASYCEIVDIFGLKVSWLGYGDPKITQMIFYTDKEDLKYVFSGFVSAKELFDYVENINNLINQRRFNELSSYIEYPVYDANMKKITNKNDFVKFVEFIVTPKFRTLLKDAKTGKNFILLNQGIMLNERGDVWLVSYVDKGILIRINNP